LGQRIAIYSREPQTRLLLGAAAAFLAVYTLGILLSPSELYLRIQSNIFYNLPGLCALFLTLRRTREGDRYERLGWGLLSFLLLAWQVGDWTYSVYDLVLSQEPPFPGIADVAYFAGYAAFLVGLPFLTYPRQIINSHWIIDALLVTFVVACFQWQLVLKPVHEAGAASSAVETLVALSYPLLDLGLVAIVIGGIFATSGRLTVRALLLLFATALLALTDSSFSYAVVAGGYDNVGNPLELGWLVPYVLIAIAATLPRSEEPAKVSARFPVVWMAMSYLLALPLPFLLVIQALRQTELNVFNLGAAGVLVLALAKQVLTLSIANRSLEEERKRARTDSLTGVLNHRGIIEEAEALLARRPVEEFSLAMVDMDGLKRINDRFGHSAGDRALMNLALRLGRDGVIVGRYGGDEFLVLGTSAVSGSDFERGLKFALAPVTMMDASGKKVTISASFGIATFPADGRDLGALLELADVAMYVDKESKRNLTPASRAPKTHVVGEPVREHAA
jgi:diguanylate cyclase (GGDEF)-like protein